MRQEKHLSQFSPVVGKRLMFPQSGSLLIPVFSLFLLCCFTFALAVRLCCPTSPPPPPDYFCPHSSPRVPPSLVGQRLLTQSDDRCLSMPVEMGFAVASVQPVAAVTSAFGQEGPYPSMCPARAQRRLRLLFNFTRKGIFPKLPLSLLLPVQPRELRPG